MKTGGRKRPPLLVQNLWIVEQPYCFCVADDSGANDRKLVYRHEPDNGASFCVAGIHQE